MRRKLFFWLDKLKISRTERRAVVSLLGLLILLVIINAVISPGSPFDKEYYRELDEQFRRQTAQIKQQEQTLLSRYEPASAGPVQMNTVAADTDTTDIIPVKNEPIDINSAGLQRLQQLNGIGATYAQRIISYRRVNGGFKSKDELLNVRGIGSTRLQKIEPFIVVGEFESKAIVEENDSFKAESPLKIENAPSDSATAAGGHAQINVNTADVESLQELPGIGPAYAKRIVAYRQKNGDFKTKNELLKIKGIGEKRLAKIKPFIKLTGQ